MPSGEDIQAALRRFVSRWREYPGSERSEAQTFLNELFACYGTDRKNAGAEFEDAHSSTGIMDLHWPGTCIIEMKAPSRALKLADHRTQALDYRRASADVAAGVEAPPYVVLCAFSRFEVWLPGRYPKEPVAQFSLDELPDRYESLLFLSGVGARTAFLDHHRQLTTGATQVVSDLYHSLADRAAAPVDELQRFILQTVWCLFAEDLSMLDRYPVQTVVDGLRRDPTRSAYAELGALYEVLNQKGNHNRIGALKGTRYVNGDLFAQPAKVHLNPAELDLLAGACEFDRRKVNQSPSRWIIDFGLRSLEDASMYPAALDVVRREVRPAREDNRRPLYRNVWWRFGEARPGMRAALAGRSRYVVAGRVAKRLNLAWQSTTVCPSDATCVFALEEDYSMGVLLSRAHGAWARVRDSTLKADLRYTPTSGFATAGTQRRDRERCPRLRAVRAPLEAVMTAAFDARSALRESHPGKVRYVGRPQP